MLKITAGVKGWRKGAPSAVTEGCFLFPPLVPVYQSFCRLSRGRGYLATGGLLPVSYRDLRDEVAECPWPNRAQTEAWLVALDDAFLKGCRDADNSMGD